MGRSRVAPVSAVFVAPLRFAIQSTQRSFTQAPPRAFCGVFGGARESMRALTVAMDGPVDTHVWASTPVQQHHCEAGVEAAVVACKVYKSSSDGELCRVPGEVGGAAALESLGVFWEDNWWSLK